MIIEQELFSEIDLDMRDPDIIHMWSHSYEHNLILIENESIPVLIAALQERLDSLKTT